MKKKNKKKIKLKHKKLYVISIIIIIILTSITIFGFKTYQNKILKDMKKHYSQYVITTKKTILYNKKHKKIGTITNNIPIQLDKTSLNNTKNKFFPIKNTNYYILYKYISKSKKQTEPKHNYITYNKNIKTTKKVTLYRNNKKAITLYTGINKPIEYQDKNNYYIKLWNKIYKVKKSKKIKEIKNNNTNQKIANHISILYYEKIEESCTDDNCTSIENFKEQISKLKENGYYTITKDEYNNYLNKYILLKEKAIYILTKSENENIANIEKELNMKIEKWTDNQKLNITNKTTTEKSDINSLDCYQIKKYSTIENILKMANGEEVQEQAPVTNPNKVQGIAVLNYHFFYDETKEACNESICLSTQKFREQLDYLKQNNYKTLTMKEFKKWMYGEMELPEKSVLITIDDGAMGTGKHNGNHLIPILEEYKMHATLFLIAGWWDINNYQSSYLDIQSHTFDMHQYGPCGRGQINCATLEEAKTDLQKSLDIIGNNDSFCFPFYMYSDTSLQAVKDLGFKLAFVGGMKKATRNNNKFLIPRYPIHSDVTLQQFINMVS